MEPAIDPAGSASPPEPTLAAVLDRLEAIERRLDRLVPGEPGEPREVEVTHRRPFTLLDAMLLVALTAVGLLPYRAITDLIGEYSWSGGLWQQTVQALLFVVLYSSPIALVWSMATIILRFRRPRPNPAPALRQPGFLGVCIALLLMLIIGPLKAVEFVFFLNIDFSVSPLIAIYLGSRAAGIGVLGAFLALRVAGPIRPTADWVDGFGRVLSWYWIVIGIACPSVID